MFNAHGQFVVDQIDASHRVLDLGCGILQQFGGAVPFEHYLAVDGFLPYLEHLNSSVSAMTLRGMLPDVCNQFLDSSWDTVILIDVLEHLEKEDGFIVLDHMERIAKYKVIVDTPLGFQPQEAWEAWGFPMCELQAHLSGWDTEEFTERGYVVTCLPNYNEQAGKMTSIMAVLEKGDA